MEDCKLSPRPAVMPSVVSAGQSDVGTAFAAESANYNFCPGEGANTLAKCSVTIGRLMKAVTKTGREVGAYALFMVIADETDAAAQAKWESYKAGKDLNALKWLCGQASADDKADAGGTAQSISNPVSTVNFNMGTVVGSYATVASMLDQLEGIEELAGVMLTFDDFVEGMKNFGERVQPLMVSRRR
jgi:pyrimidine oxygenase